MVKTAESGGDCYGSPYRCKGGTAKKLGIDNPSRSGDYVSCCMAHTSIILTDSLHVDKLDLTLYL